MSTVTVKKCDNCREIIIDSEYCYLLDSDITKIHIKTGITSVAVKQGDYCKECFKNIIQRELGWNK